MADALRPESEYTSPAKFAEAYWRDAKDYYRNYHWSIGEELNFSLKQDHYETDEVNTKDRRRVQPKDPSLMSLIRHKKARILKASQHFDAVPVDDATDPYAADYWHARLMMEIQNPDNGYREVFDDWVNGALAARIWAAELTYHPYAGIVPRSRDPRTLFWPPGFKTPHDKACPWIIVEDRMSIPQIEEMGRTGGWKNTGDLVSDGVRPIKDQIANMRGPEIIWRSSNTVGPNDTGEKFVTVLRMYFRFDRKTLKKRRNNVRMLPEYERYMQCKQCGYESPPQHAVEGSYPEQMQCPTCGGVMERQDAVDIEDEYLKYTDGRRLLIVSPYNDRVFYDGDWEFARMRHWPVVLYKGYNHPVEPIPMSDTAYYRSLQLIIDSMYRMGYEQMVKAKGWIMAPEDGLFDAFGDPWQFSDFQDIMYYKDIITPGAVQWFQPQGVNAAWNVYLQAVQGSFSANKGTGDLGLTSEQSKDIAVGTVRTLVETGEIPVDDHISTFQVAMGRLLTRLCEALASTEDRAKMLKIMTHMGPMVVNVAASALPGVDIIITGEPEMTQEKMDVAQKAMELFNIPDPATRRLLGELIGFPAYMLDRLDRNQQMMQAQQMQQQMQQVPPQGPPPGGTPMGGPPMGGNGPGMMPQMGAPQPAFAGGGVSG